MVRIVLCVLVCFFSFFTFCNAQERYDADLRSPLGIPLVLAANFGELRPNHFHTGIDLKTNGKEGFKLYSVADGYVSRIHISPYGYGKAIYVNHPELGITTVYAHCSEFANAIDSAVIAYQNTEKSNQIDYYLTPEELPVKQGDYIAVSGNSGGSTAPHLHFEIRDMWTEHPYNPLLFCLFDSIADDRYPEINEIKIYALSKLGYPIPNQFSYLKLIQSKGQYRIPNDTCTIPASFCSENGGIGFSFDVVDRLNDANNPCAIYESSLIFNKDTVFKQNMSELDFSTNRQINTHIDYQESINRGRKYQKQFKTPHNQLAIYPLASNGVLPVNPNQCYDVEYNCRDIKYNTSKIAFAVNVLDGNKREENTPYDKFSPDYLYPDSTYEFKGENYQINLSAYSIYETCPKILNFISNTLTFGEASIPLNSEFILKWKLSSVPNYSNQTVIAVKDYRGRSKALNTTLENDYLLATPKQLGTFFIAKDSMQPTIKAYNFSVKTQFKKNTVVKWKIDDDFSGIKDYNLYSDGVWQVLNYEYKRNEIYTTLPALSVGKHELKLIVTDQVGNANESVYTIDFVDSKNE